MDFLGKIYRAYKDLIAADPANKLNHMANCDMSLGKVRKGFKMLETFVILDNFFRSISGLSPALYQENQPGQSALEKIEYLTSLATLEVKSTLRTLEQPEMYKDGNASSPPSPQCTPSATGTQVDQSVGVRPIEKTPPTNQASGSTQISHSQAMNLLDSQGSTGQAIHWPTPISIVDQGMLTNNTNEATPQQQPCGMPVSFVSMTQVRSDIIALPTVNTVVPLAPAARGTPFANPKALPVQQTVNRQNPHHRRLPTLARSVEKRTTPQTGAVLKLPARNVKVRTMAQGSAL